jgi:hypothetical protein
MLPQKFSAATTWTRALRCVAASVIGEKDAAPMAMTPAIAPA